MHALWWKFHQNHRIFLAAQALANHILGTKFFLNSCIASIALLHNAGFTERSQLLQCDIILFFFFVFFCCNIFYSIFWFLKLFPKLLLLSFVNIFIVFEHIKFVFVYYHLNKMFTVIHACFMNVIILCFWCL